MSKPVAWSYSVLSSFETCPRKHYETRVAKTTPDPMGIDAQLGIDAHKALELRAKDGVEIPKVIRSRAGNKEATMSTDGWEEIISKILAVNGELLTETQIALNKNLQPVKWFGKDVWVRGVIDLGKLRGEKGMLFDWKSGKRKPNNEQLELFAGLGFAKWPELEEISTAFLWLKSGESDRNRYTRSDVPEIWNKFLPRVRRLELAFENNKWPEKPSGLCKRWCPCHGCPHNGNYLGR